MPRTVPKIVARPSSAVSKMIAMNKADIRRISSSLPRVWKWFTRAYKPVRGKGWKKLVRGLLQSARTRRGGGETTSTDRDATKTDAGGIALAAGLSKFIESATVNTNTIPVTDAF